ncbi:hypothetical protein FJ366_02690 [Candidatus Dependentiae bacterium]|nr:hypothetical protein [Candidatus Dependentiae bacterium]
MVSFRYEIAALFFVFSFSVPIDAGKWGCCSSSAVDVIVPGQRPVPAPKEPVHASAAEEDPVEKMLRENGCLVGPSARTSQTAQAVGSHFSGDGTSDDASTSGVGDSDVEDDDESLERDGLTAVAFLPSAPRESRPLARTRKIHVRRLSPREAVHAVGDMAELEEVVDGVVPSLLQKSLSKSEFFKKWMTLRERVHEFKDKRMNFRQVYTLGKTTCLFDPGILLEQYQYIEQSFYTCLTLAQELLMGSLKKSPCGFDREHLEPESKHGIIYLGGMICQNPYGADRSPCGFVTNYETFRPVCKQCRIDYRDVCFMDLENTQKLLLLKRLISTLESQLDAARACFPD